MPTSMEKFAKVAARYGSLKSKMSVDEFFLEVLSSLPESDRLKIVDELIAADGLDDSEGFSIRTGAIYTEPALADIKGVLVAMKDDCRAPGNLPARCAWVLAAQAVALAEETAEERDGFCNGQGQMQAAYSGLWEHYVDRIEECAVLRKAAQNLLDVARAVGRTGIDGPLPRALEDLRAAVATAASGKSVRRSAVLTEKRAVVLPWRSMTATEPPIYQPVLFLPHDANTAVQAYLISSREGWVFGDGMQYSAGHPGDLWTEMPTRSVE